MRHAGIPRTKESRRAGKKCSKQRVRQQQVRGTSRRGSNIRKSLTALTNVIRPVIAAKLCNPKNGRCAICYGILDSGAEADYLSERVARELGLETEEDIIGI